MRGDLVFETAIHTNVSLQMAPAFKQSIYEYARNSKGSDQYLYLTDEVIERLGTDGSLSLKLVEKKEKVS